MKKPILIVGYERSGTTLLRRIVSMHPSLEYDIVHEQAAKLFKSKNKEDAIKRLTFNSRQAGNDTGGVSSLVAGQKIPYLNFRTLKISVDKFKELFGDFYIIHIVRDPVGAINSQVRTFGKNVNRCIDEYFNSVPRCIKYLSSLDNVLTVCFEDLLRSPVSTTKLVYDWIGDFNEDDSFIDRVVTTKEPWEYNLRMMPGLRYFGSIQMIDRPKTISDDSVAKIMSRSKR